MKIDVSKIDGYADMSAEDKLKALENFEYEDFSAENEKLKNSVSKANSEASEWKKKHNALLSEDERKREEESEKYKSIEEELNNLRKEKTISEYTAQFAGLGYPAELAKETALAMVNGDTKKVFANHSKYLADRETAIKAELLNKTPRPSEGSSGNGTITKEQFDNMGYTDRVKLYRESPDVYAELNKN